MAYLLSLQHRRIGFIYGVRPPWDSPGAADPPVDAAGGAVADRTIPQDPNLPHDQEFVNELRLIGQAVSLGQSTVDKGAADLQALIERLAKK